MKTKACYSLATLMVSLGSAAWIQAASTIQFSASTYIVIESVGTVTLTVQRTGDTNTVVGVDYATADGTATNGLKYTAVSGTLTFGASETNKVIVVPILNNGLVEGTKNFKVILNNPTNAVLGTRTNATVSITDNDLGIQFQSATYTVAEDAGSVLLGVARGDDGNFPVTVEYVTVNSTAISELDYTGVTNTLSFAAGETLKQFTVPILNDSLKEANKTFGVTLSNPTGGGVLGSPKTATITIFDNDPGFQFEFASYSVAEDAGVARINVLRGTDDTNSPVTVDFATTDLTATTGLEYTGITNTLIFAPGERVKLVTVPILNDGVKEASKNFRVTLSNPTGGAVLGSRATVTVTIVDNDPGLGFEFSSYSVWEDAGAVSVTVLRGNDMALGPITVDYITSNLSATAGQDYQAVSGTVAFGENETVKTIPIPILRDGSVTNNTSFRVTLSNPTGGAMLGTAFTTVNILNAPELGTFRTVSPSAALSIQREGDVNLLTWSGGGQLQRADRPTGPWQTLTSVINPSSQTVRTVQSPLPTTFYRVTYPRPVDVYIPSSYDGQTPVPFVILLHGGGGTGAAFEDILHLRPLAEARGFLYCYPDGLFGQWNDGNLGQGGVDDVGYLRAVIEEVGRQFALDRKRVHVIGYSNGGFMAYRLACESADLIAGIAPIAGVTFPDTSRCQPSQPVNILHIHGTADSTISYVSGGSRPGAMQTIQIWANYNGASSPVTDPVPSMDLVLDAPGLDTVITRYTNAPPGGAVELWTIIGGPHAPLISPEFSPRIIDWVLAHPRP